MPDRRNPRHGFSITELMVIVSVIVLLLGLLIPVLGAFRKSGLMTKSMANMRQVASWMALYSGDNRETVVPSQFDYRQNSYPGKVRAVRTPGYGEAHRGTWADILWTVFEGGVYPDAIASGSGPTPNPGGTPGPGGGSPCPAGPCSPCHDYRYDSPDRELYCRLGTDIDNPLRSAAANTRGTLNMSPQELATPFGCGAQEAGQPGYFAANNFFNADAQATDCWTHEALAADWYSRSQIRGPDRSMYLVDSVAGEVIAPAEHAYQYYQDGPGGPGVDGDEPPLGPVEVDFRYADACLMLYMDGHIGTQLPWADLAEIEGPGRGVRIRDLTSR
jgi:type II secretory pathway pseudopilin PulG